MLTIPLSFPGHSAQIIDRLPMTVDTLKASKLGKLVVKIVKEPPTAGKCSFLCVSRFVILRRRKETGSQFVACYWAVTSHTLDDLLLGAFINYMYLTCFHSTSFQSEYQQSRTWHPISSADGDRWSQIQMVQSPLMYLHPTVCHQNILSWQVPRMSRYRSKSKETQAHRYNDVQINSAHQESSASCSSCVGEAYSEEGSEAPRHGRQRRQVRFIVLLSTQAETEIAELQESTCAACSTGQD
jgi:hypothetical protein